LVRRQYTAVTALLLMAAILSAQAAVAQTTYTITVKTDSASYTTGQLIKITGSVSPPPGPSTAVTVRIFNPSKPMQLVYVAEANVSASTGAFNSSLVAGGGPGWIAGTYTVNATWGAFPPVIFQTASFNYTVATTTTTTSTTSSTSATSTTATASSTTTSQTTTSTTSSTSSTTTSVSTSSATSTTTTPSSTSTTPVPEFPYQLGFAGAFLVVIAAAYLLMRRRPGAGPAGVTAH